MWITNGGFADLFIVFAKVVGEGADGFTAFLVERGFPGVSNGKEEHKMGLHGSSTTPLILQDARVPAENVLGEIGKALHGALFLMIPTSALIGGAGRKRNAGGRKTRDALWWTDRGSQSARRRWQAGGPAGLEGGCAKKLR